MDWLHTVNVLIIDDEPEIREMLQRMLERRSCQVFTAADGVEGLKICREIGIHVVLADIMMPNMDGLEFLKQVHSVNPKSAVVMVTGHSTVGRCIKAIEYGACGYLLKPVSIDDIVKAIGLALEANAHKAEMLEKALHQATHSV